MTAEEPILVKKAMYRRGMWPFYKYVTPFQKARIKFRHGKCEMGDGRMTLSDSVGNMFDLVDGELTPWDTRYPTPLVCAGISPMVFEGIHAYQWDCESIAPAVFTLFGTNKTGLVLVEAIIPQGAYYYLGTNGDIVADRMTVTDIDTGPIPWETPPAEKTVPWTEPPEIERPSNDDEG